MPRTTLVIAAALAVAACDGTVPSAPGREALVPPTTAFASNGHEATATESARGAGTVIFGANVEHLNFSAERAVVAGNPFAATGNATFNDRSAGVSGRIRIECLNVTGNTATLSGIVTESSDPTIVGFEAVWQVVDNDVAKGKPTDFSSTLLLHAVGTGSDCSIPGEFDLAPFQGHLEVQPEIGS